MANETRKIDLPEFVLTLKRQGITSYDLVRKDINFFIEQKAREKRIPLVGTFELTPYCNLDCKMCYVHLDKNKNTLLEPEKWIYLIDSAIDEGMKQAKLTGGECLTYPGFDEIFLHLERKKIRISIASNGILMDKKRIEFFQQHPPKSIQISLYGSSDDEYEKVTGHRSFETVYNNLISIRDTHLPVSIAITPSHMMMENFDRVLLLAESLKIPYKVNSLLIPPREDTGRAFEDLSNDEYITAFVKWNRIRKTEITPIPPEELPQENLNGTPRYGIQCGAGRSSFAILHDGTMCPCISLNELGAKPCEIGFKEAWKAITDLADHYILPEECENCVYRSRCLICAAAHKNATAKGHCDHRVCERTKGYISAGIIPFGEEKM